MSLLPDPGKISRMKGSKKRTFASDDFREKRAKKAKSVSSKEQKQISKQTPLNTPLPIANAEPSQPNDQAQKQNTETPGVPNPTPIASSSRDVIMNEASKPEPTKDSGAMEGQGARVSKGKAKHQSKDYKIRKLEPRRPFPTVPTSVSATGPRSGHVEGKNYICVTRRTKLGAYLRRCKELALKDG